MANSLDIYDPIFYANEALIALEKALGMAGRVYRDYSQTPTDQGSSIQIRRPSTFTAADAPATAADITATHETITLQYWREVKFALTDKELTFTKERIINDHIRPAAYALADDVDQKLAALAYKVGWHTTVGATPAVTDITALRKLMMDNAVPFSDPALVHWMLGTGLEAGFLNLDVFHRADASVDQGELQRNANLGRRFGFNFFTNQNTPTLATNNVADLAGTVTGATAKGATTISVAALSITSTIKKGQSLVFAGHTQRYTVTADFTTDGAGAATGVGIFPALRAAVANGEVVTFSDNNIATAKGLNVAFHRNAFALATAPLSDLAGRLNLGVRMATVADPITQLALRSRVYYEGGNSKVSVAFDILYGLECLDPNLAAVALF